jgi:hypothetical protein
MKKEEKELPPTLRWLDKLSVVMDSSLKVPGTNFRFGADPLLGLIPIAGELSTFVISAGIVLTLTRHGASRKLVILMVINVLIDAVIGSIPVLGNIFDFFYKANNRNIRLMKKYYVEGKYQGEGKGILIFAGLTFLIVFLLMIWGLWKLSLYLYHYFF